MNLKSKKNTSLYGFNNVDAITTFLNNRDESQEVNPDWKKGFILIKIGKGDYDLEAAKKRVASEYSAMSLGRPHIKFQIQMPYRTIEKIDDEIREKMITQFPLVCKNIDFSDKANDTGEYILVNIHNIFKKLNKTNLFKKLLTNEQIKAELLNNNEFNILFTNLLSSMIQSVIASNTKHKCLTFIPYKKQEYIIDKTQIALDNGIKYINIYAATRAAKTAATVEICKRNKTTPIFIGKNLTSQASAVTDYKRWFKTSMKMVDFSLHTGKKNKGEAFNPKNVLKWLELKCIYDGDLSFIIDEADDQTHAPQALKSLVATRDLLISKGYNIKFTIAMSATRPYQADKILSALKEPHEKIALVELSYEQCRALDPDNTPKRSILVQSFENNKATINFSNTLESNNKGGADDFAQLLVTHSIGDIKVADNKIFEMDKINKDIFIRISTNTTSKISSLIKSLKKILSDTYMVIQISGNNDEYIINGKKVKMSNKHAEKIIDFLKSENPDKTIVMVSMGMATTSFTIKSIGRTIVIAPDGVTADIYQGSHRSTSPNGSLKAEAQMVVITTADFRYKDLLHHETEKLTVKEKERHFKLFVDNGSKCIYNLIKTDGQMVSRELDNKIDLINVLEHQSRHLATANSFELTLIDAQINIGKGLVNILNQLTKDDSYKGYKVDGDGNKFNNQTPTICSDDKKPKPKITPSDYQKMANAAMLLPIRAIYLHDIKTISELYNSEIVWGEVKLVKESFKYLMDENETWKEKFEMRWNIIANLDDSESLNVIQEALDMEDPI